MSGLILPPGYTHSAASDKAALDRANEAAARLEDIEPYYSELPGIMAAAKKMNRLFMGTGEEAWTERQFETTAKNLFGEAGMIVEVEWLQAYNADTGKEEPFKAPNVRFVGRVDKQTERDHDKVKYEVTSGMADGQPGFIRSDGSKHEEPLRKIIT